MFVWQVFYHIKGEICSFRKIVYVRMACFSSSKMMLGCFYHHLLMGSMMHWQLLLCSFINSTNGYWEQSFDMFSVLRAQKLALQSMYANSNSNTIWKSRIQIWTVFTTYLCCPSKFSFYCFSKVTVVQWSIIETIFWKKCSYFPKAFSPFVYHVSSILRCTLFCILVFLKLGCFSQSVACHL